MKLTKNVSWQCPHVTRHMPGIVGTGGVTGEGARLIIRLQLGLGQATRWDELLQINRQLQGHLTYFFPGGAFLMGCLLCCVFKNYRSGMRNHIFMDLQKCKRWGDQVSLPLLRYIDYISPHVVPVSTRCRSLQNRHDMSPKMLLERHYVINKIELI